MSGSQIFRFNNLEDNRDVSVQILHRRLDPCACELAELVDALGGALISMNSKIESMHFVG